MSLTLFINTGASAEVVRFVSHDFSREGTTAPVYSGLRIATAGNLQARTATGSWQGIGSWLLNGSAGDFYVSRTIDSGTLTTDAGAGPLQLNTDRDYSINGLNKTTQVSFEISDDVSGSPVRASVTYVFQAFFDNGM